MKGAELLTLVDLALSAACRDTTRAHICGALLEPHPDDERAVRVVCTDGHRLHVGHAALREPWAGSAFVPSDVLEVLRLLAKGRPGALVSLGLDGLTLRVRVGTVMITAECGNPAKYPPWRRVVPDEWVATAVVDRAALHRAVKRAGTNKDGAIALSIGDDAFIVHDLSPADADGCGQPALLVKGVLVGGPSARVGINPRYVDDLLGEMPRGVVEVAFPRDPTFGPVRFRSLEIDTLGLIMPMRMP